jgi:hypothetical protein
MGNRCMKTDRVCIKWLIAMGIATVFSLTNVVLKCRRAQVKLPGVSWCSFLIMEIQL